MKNNEKLYTESEIVQMIRGLQIVYYSKSRLGKLFYRPFLTALDTLLAQIIGEKLIAAKEARDAANYYESLLDQDQ